MAQLVLPYQHMFGSLLSVADATQGVPLGIAGAEMAPLALIVKRATGELRPGDKESLPSVEWLSATITKLQLEREQWSQAKCKEAEQRATDSETRAKGAQEMALQLSRARDDIANEFSAARDDFKKELSLARETVTKLTSDLMDERRNHQALKDVCARRDLRPTETELDWARELQCALDGADKLAVEMAATQAKLDAEKKHNAALECDVATRNALLEMQERHITHTEQQLKDMRTKDAQLREELAQKNATQVEERAQRDRERREYSNTLRNELAAAWKNVQAMEGRVRGERDAQRALCEVWTRRLARMEAQLALEHTDHNQQTAAQQQQIDELTQQLEQARAAVAELSQRDRAEKTARARTAHATGNQGLIDQRHGTRIAKLPVLQYEDVAMAAVSVATKWHNMTANAIMELLALLPPLGSFIGDVDPGLPVNVPVLLTRCCDKFIGTERNPTTGRCTLAVVGAAGDTPVVLAYSQGPFEAATGGDVVFAASCGLMRALNPGDGNAGLVRLQFLGDTRPARIAANQWHVCVAVEDETWIRQYDFGCQFQRHIRLKDPVRTMAFAGRQLYACVGHNNASVLVLDEQLQVVDTLIDAGALVNPTAMAVDGDLVVFVDDYRELLTFDRHYRGKFRARKPLPTRVDRIVLHDGHVWFVADGRRYSEQIS